MHIIAFITIFTLIFTNANSCIKSFATIPSTKVVTSYACTPSTTFNWVFSYASKIYEIDDASDFSSSTGDGSVVWFYKSGEDTFSTVTGVGLFGALINKRIGKVYSPALMLTLYNTFMTRLLSIYDVSTGKVCGGFYTTTGTLLGFCIDDITGCHYDSVRPTDMTVNSPIVNNIYNFDKDYTSNYLGCDFFNFDGMDKQAIINGFVPTTTEAADYLALHLDDSKTGFNVNYYTNEYDPSESGYICEYDQYFGVLYFDTLNYLYGIDNNSFSSFTTGMNIGTGDTITTNDLIYSTGNYFLGLYANGSNQTLYNWSNQSSGSYSGTIFGLATGATSFSSFIGAPVTIYKSSTIVNQVVNQTYSPSYYYSSTYNEFNVNTDNSTNISNTDIDNSVTNNETIYNNITDNYYEYVDNTYVDNTTIINNITYEINNYYGDEGGGGDDPDDPSDPDDPDDILDALLAAILKFFQALSKIIATVFTGIVEGLTIVVEAAGSIIEAIPNLTELFSSLLGWLPAPIPEVLGLGISICIIAAVFKFIRG